MAHTIMFIPVTVKADRQPNPAYLQKILTLKNINSSIFPEFDLKTIEDFLGIDHEEELLEKIAKQREELLIKSDIVLIQGASLMEPYGAELNFSIATALGAAIIFEVNIEEDQETAMRKLKIITHPYRHHYKHPILGFVINQKNHKTEFDLKKYRTLFDLELPLLGTFPYLLEKEKNADGTKEITSAVKSTDFNFSMLKNFIDKPTPIPITPPIFRYKLIEHACATNKTIVLPEGDEPRTLQAANICVKRGIANCILLGEKEKILESAAKINILLDEKIKIVQPKSVKAKYITPLFQLRQKKGLSIKQAETLLEDNTMLGTMMVHLGDADGLVSGAVNTTSNTVRPALQTIKTKADAKRVSSVFFMCLPEQVVLFADCAITPDPTSKELADIAIQTANSAVAFGIEPKIAMLSYSTEFSGNSPSVDKVRQAAALARSIRPDLLIEGPIQYDAAVSEKTALVKAPNSKIAGDATVFIMPNLDVGNIAYKVVQQNTGIICVGPMLQGLNKPVNDLSRGCTVEDIIYTIAITAVQANQETLIANTN